MKTLFLLIFIFASVFHYQSVILENQKTWLFFIEQLLPSLFLLCVLIQMIPLPKKNMPTFFNRIFHMDTASLLIVIKAILLGSPAQSYMINALLKEHKLTKAQSRRLIVCTAIPSFSFMMMSLAFMTSQKTALIVFTIHVLNIFILLFITRKTAISLNSPSTATSLYQAVSFSLHTMALILAYLLIAASLKSLLLIYLKPLSSPIQLLMEFSSGCAYYAQYDNHLPYLLICIGFGGFTSHLQIMGGCKESELRYRDYLKFRLCHIFFNLSLYFIFSLL